MITTFAEFLLLEYNTPKLTLKDLQEKQSKINDVSLLKLMSGFNNQELFSMSCKLGLTKGIEKALENKDIKLSDLDLYAVMKKSDNIDKTTKLLINYFSDNKTKKENIIIYYLINVVDFRTVENVLDKEMVKSISNTDRKYVLDEMTQLQGKKFYIEKLFKKYENK